MTGRELIIYILQNGLEDEDIFKDGCFLGFMHEGQHAAKFGVGVATVKVWTKMGYLRGVLIGNSFYYPISSVDPRTVLNLKEKGELR